MCALTLRIYNHSAENAAKCRFCHVSSLCNHGCGHNAIAHIELPRLSNGCET